MICPFCGAQNPNNNYFCGSCGRAFAQQQQQQQMPPPPPPPQGNPYMHQQPMGNPYMNQPPYPPAMIKNYMVESIIATLFCCLPLGIVAIIFASKVNNCLAVNDIAGANSAAQSARTWLIVSVVAGVLQCIAIIFFEVLFSTMLYCLE